MAITVFLRQAKPNGLPITMTFKKANYVSYPPGRHIVQLEYGSQIPVAAFYLDCIVGWEIKPEDAKAK